MTQEISQITRPPKPRRRSSKAPSSAAASGCMRAIPNVFTPRMGNAQRLPNGNTLINEASFGRFFGVTPQGETVWEYVNPYFGGPPNAQTNIVFGAYRYTPEEIAAARSMG